MSHTYTSGLFHVVFSTKQRRSSIPADIQDRLWAFLGGIARRNGFKAIAVGRTDNHVHMLLSIPATMPLATAMQLLKGGSSKWLNETIGGHVQWQQGYGAFSVSVSH
jgi:putative transposase